MKEKFENEFGRAERERNGRQNGTKERIQKKKYNNNNNNNNRKAEVNRRGERKDGDKEWDGGGSQTETMGGCIKESSRRERESNDR